jgi:hypothetical protein
MNPTETGDMMNYKVLAAVTLAAVVAQASEDTIRSAGSEWIKRGYLPATSACTTGVDSTLEAEGTPNLAIVCEPVESGAVVMNQEFNAAAFRGQRVRWSGMIRTDDAEPFSAGAVNGWPTGANLTMRVLREGTNMVMGWSKSPGLLGDTDWTAFEIVADIPLDAETIITGFGLSGSGRAWLTSPAFEIVGFDVPVTLLPIEAAQPPGPNLQLR